MKVYYKGIDINKNSFNIYDSFGNKAFLEFKFESFKERKKIIDKYIF